MIAAIDYAEHTQTRARHPASYRMPATELWDLLKATDFRVKRCAQGHGLVEVLGETDRRPPSPDESPQRQHSADLRPTRTQLACDILKTTNTTRARPASAMPLLRPSFGLEDSNDERTTSSSYHSRRRHHNVVLPGQQRNLPVRLIRTPNGRTTSSETRTCPRIRITSAHTRWGGVDVLDRREDPRFLLRRQPKAEHVPTAEELLKAAEAAGRRESTSASGDSSPFPDVGAARGSPELESPSASRLGLDSPGTFGGLGGGGADLENSVALSSCGYVRQKTRRHRPASPVVQADESATVDTDLMTMSTDLSLMSQQRAKVAVRLEHQINEFEARRNPVEKPLPFHLRLSAGGGAPAAKSEDHGAEDGGQEPAVESSPEQQSKKFTPSAVKFNLSRQARLHFGSRVALETKKNHFLMLVPEYALSRRRSRPKGNVCLSVMVSKPLNQCEDEDLLVFKVIDMQNPGSNRPVMEGDDIWLQVMQSGDDKPSRRKKKQNKEDLPQEWRLGAALGELSGAGGKRAPPKRLASPNLAATPPAVAPGMINMCVIGARVDKASQLPNSVNTRRYLGSNQSPNANSKANRRCGVPVPLNTVMAKDRAGSMGDSAVVDYVGRWKIRNAHRGKPELQPRRSRDTEDVDSIMNYGEIVLEQDFFCLVADSRTGAVYLRSHTTNEMVAGAVDNSVRGNQLRMRMLHDTVETGMGKIEMQDLEVIEEATSMLLQSQKMREGAISYVSTTTDEAPITSGRPFTAGLRRNIASRARELERDDIEKHLVKEDSITHFSVMERRRVSQSLDSGDRAFDHWNELAQVEPRVEGSVQQVRDKARRDWDPETEHIHRTVHGRITSFSTVDGHMSAADFADDRLEGAVSPSHATTSASSSTAAAATSGARLNSSNASHDGSSTVTGSQSTSSKLPSPQAEAHLLRAGTTGRPTKRRIPHVGSNPKPVRLVATRLGEEVKKKDPGPKVGSLVYVGDQAIKRHFEKQLLSDDMNVNDRHVKHWLQFKDQKKRSEQLMQELDQRLQSQEPTVDSATKTKATIASSPTVGRVSPHDTLTDDAAEPLTHDKAEVPAAVEPTLTDASNPATVGQRPSLSGLRGQGHAHSLHHRRGRVATTEEVAASVQVTLDDRRSIDVHKTLVEKFGGHKMTMAVKLKEVFATYAKQWQQILSACFVEFSFHGIEQVCNMCESTCSSFVSTGLATAVEQLRSLTKMMKMRATTTTSFSDPEMAKDAKKLLEARLERLHWMLVLLVLATEALGYPALVNRTIGVPGWRKAAHPQANRKPCHGTQKGGGDDKPGTGLEQFSQFSQYSLKSERPGEHSGMVTAEESAPLAL